MKKYARVLSSQVSGPVRIGTLALLLALFGAGAALAQGDCIKYVNQL